MTKSIRICNCGSGLVSWALYDAKRIYCGRVCEKCEKEKRAQFRPEIFKSYNQGDVDEPIEPEGW
jgi:hypothetical protein